MTRAVPMLHAVAALLMTACSERADEVVHAIVRDSAGITIVSNELAPDDLAHWRTEPKKTIGQLDGPDEYSFGQISDVEIDARGRPVTPAAPAATGETQTEVL
jgi:hypothetical protein